MMTPALLLAAALPLTACPLPAVAPQDPQSQGQNQPQAPTPMPIPVALVCRRGDRPIEVDGSLVDWPELPALTLADLRQLSGTADAAWRGEADLSAFAFLMWDEENLWFAATVRDEWHRELDANTIRHNETPLADAVVLTIDPRRDTRSLGPDPGRADDIDLWMSSEDSHEVLRWDRLRGAAGIVDGGKVVVSHDVEQGITTYELKLPWAGVLLAGQQPAPGTVFDLQVVVNDFDESTDHMPQTRLGWTFGCGVTADPALMGSAVLLDALRVDEHNLPVVPERPAVAEDPRLLPPYWTSLDRALRQHPPGVHDGSIPPGAVGGIARLEVLEELDYELGRYPRVDFVEFCQRQHRRMSRELAAAEQRGLPLFWAIRSRVLAAQLDAPPPSGTWRISRLPQNGWVVQGERQAFSIDPAGADARLLWGASDFALLTQPLDMTRRNDQLLLKMHDARPSRPFHAHITFHLPRLSMADMPLVEPGQSLLQSNGVRITAIGDKRVDGTVLFAMGYGIDLPGNVRVLVAGPAMSEDSVPEGGFDAVILSPFNPLAVEVARAAAPAIVLIDDAFRCFHLPGVGRVDLRMAHALQQAILPLPSVLLAPGESWEITRRK
ncbi:MAG: hypothetical protein AB7O97_18520 [Planctomycetota bacterium]